MNLGEQQKSAKIKYQRMPDLVMEQLMDWIMDGTIPMGAKLNAEELATKMGVSRMPVREALRNMEKSGIVESVPYVGARVVELNMSDVVQIYIMRQALEPIAAFYACMNVTDSQISTLENIEDKLDEVLLQPHSNAKQIFVLNREFHFTIFKISEMRHFVNVISNLWDNLAFFKLIYGRKYVNDKNSALKKIAEHRNYISLLKAKDAEGLKAATNNTLSKHLAGMSDKVTDYIMHS